MTMLAERTLAGVVPGDHACCSFGSTTEQAALVGRLARDAAQRGERLIYVADQTRDEDIVAAMAAAGVDTSAHLAAGTLELRRVGDLYLEEDFDPEQQIAGYEVELHRAREDGCTGLSVMAEMSWALEMVDDLDPLLAYERGINRLFADGDARGVCQYDRRVFAPETLARVEAAHDPWCRSGHDAITAARAQLRIVERAGEARIVLSGELDDATAAFAASRLEEHLEGEGHVFVDARHLYAIDESGARVLVETARRLTGDRTLQVIGAPRALKQLLERCGWGDEPRIALAP